MKGSAEHLTLKQMRILQAIFTQGSVSAAARVLRMSQPAVSLSLRGLREVLGDVLVIPNNKKLMFTERALMLKPAIARILAEVDAMVAPQDQFNPSTSKHIFRLASPDNLSPDWIAKLFGRLRQLAPQAMIELNSFSPDFNPVTALEDGRFDVVLGNWTELPINLHHHDLYEDDIVCLMRRNHPLLLHPDGLTREAYLAAEHIVPAHYAVGKSGVVDAYLAHHRLKRQVVVTVPFFNLAPFVLLETNLIFTVNRTLANHFAAHLPLTVCPAPLPFPRIVYQQLWHHRTHHSRANIWLREQINGVSL